MTVDHLYIDVHLPSFIGLYITESYVKWNTVTLRFWRHFVWIYEKMLFLFFFILLTETDGISTY